MEEPVVRLKYRFLGILYGWVLGRVDPDVFSILDFFGLSFCLEGGDWGVLFCIYLDVFSVIKCLYVSKKKNLSFLCDDNSSGVADFHCQLLCVLHISHLVNILLWMISGVEASFWCIGFFQQLYC